MSEDWHVDIVEVDTGKTESRVGPCSSEAHAAQIERGICINLDHERYFTVVHNKKDSSN